MIPHPDKGMVMINLQSLPKGERQTHLPSAGYLS